MARRFLSNWGNQFGREPLNVYQEKEKERTVALVDSAFGKKYGDLPPLPSLGTASRQSFIDADRAADTTSAAPALLPQLPQSPNGGGGWKSKFRSVGGKALDIANAGRDYVGGPIAGNLIANWENGAADAASYLGAASGTGPIGAMAANAGLALAQTVTPEGYKRGRKRDQEVLASDLPVGAKVGYAGLTDPFTFVGPGALKGVTSAARLGRAGKIAGAILETPASVSAGAIVGSSAAAQFGDQVPGLNRVPEEFRPLVGGLAGGMTPATARGARSASKRLPRTLGDLGLAEEAPVAAVTGDMVTARTMAEGTQQAAEAQRDPYLRALHKAAASAGAEFDPALEKHAVKGVERMEQKVAAGRKVTDALRSTLFSEDPVATAAKVADEMEAQGYKVQQSHKYGPRGIEDRWTTREGYGDVTLKMTSQSGDAAVKELQIMPRWMFEAKQGPGHALYELERSMPEVAKRAPELADEALAIEREAKAAGRNYYAEATRNKKAPAATEADRALAARARTMLDHPGLADAHAEIATIDKAVNKILATPAPEKPTVKKVDIFGDVLDTKQTEAELNGWRESQGSLFERDKFKKAPVATAPKGQRSLFDLFGQEDLPELPVDARRARMADVEGNDVVRMRGDQIAEALGKSNEEVRAYRELDARTRNPDGSPNRRHPEYAKREAVRKMWTQEYVDRNGRQPVIVNAPGSRAARYGEIDARMERLGNLPPEQRDALTVGTDTGGEFEGRFDTDLPRNERIMQLERIASDESASPEMRERARERLLQERGARLDGTEPVSYGQDAAGGAAKTLVRAFTGTGSPASLITRAAAGYAGSKLEGEDNSEALKRSILSLVPGAAGRAALRNERGMEAILKAVANGSGDTGEGGPKMRMDSVSLPHESIAERPELFQGRDADPGKTYKESRVNTIVENFDPNRLEPGLVVHDVSSDDYIVVRGHHRLEAMKRVAAKGELPEKSDWQVIDADLSNPADVGVLKELAQLSNFGVAEPNLRERLRTMKVLQENGNSAGEIQGKMRLSSQEHDDLAYIARSVPDDLVDRLTELPKTAQETAAEIARIGAEYGLREQDIRSSIGRYVLNPDKARTRTQVRDAMERGARAWKEAQAAGLQMGMFGEDDIETVLRAVDLLKEKEQAILLEKRRANSLIRSLGNYSENPELRPAAEAIIDDARTRIIKLEDDLDRLRNGFNEANRARYEPRPDEGVDEGLVSPVDATPQQTGPNLFGEDVAPSAPPAAVEPLAEAGTGLPALPPLSERDALRLRGQRSGDSSFDMAGFRTEPVPSPNPNRAEEFPPLAASERTRTGEVPSARGAYGEELPPLAETAGTRTEPVPTSRGARAEDFLPIEGAGRTGEVPTSRGARGEEFPQLGPERTRTGEAVPTGRGAYGSEFPELGPTPTRTGEPVPSARGARAEEFLPVEGAGRTGPVPSARGARGEEFLPVEGAGRTGEAVPSSKSAEEREFEQIANDLGRSYGQRPAPLSGPRQGDVPQSRYAAEIPDTEATAINAEWERIAEPPKVGPEGAERGGFVNKLLIEWPNTASRMMFTAATSGDIGSAFIQSAYLAWTHPKEWARTLGQSFSAAPSAARREGYRAALRTTIEGAFPENMRSTIYDKVHEYGFRISKEADEMSGDLGTHGLESTKLGPVGAWFRGTRRQFEVQTEGMRTQAFTDIIRAQRSANMAKGLGDVVMPDQLRGAINVSNHLTGATKLGLHPAAGIAFGAPRFLMSQFALLADAFVGKGISANYARRELVKSFGMITSATVAANLAMSGGRDAFGPGLGGPQDIKTWDDMKGVITSPNFGRVRVGDADISLFGPLDPLARTFFKELANVPELLAGEESATFPGTDLFGTLENKASPLARAFLDTARGENKFTGKQYNSFGDWLVDNAERAMPIFTQNAKDALEGRGSWLGTAAEFTGLKSSPTTPYERAVGVLDSIPGEYWVVDAKSQQIRPPATVWELTAKQREELRTQHPDIDTYLRKRETDPTKPFMKQLTDQYANVQTYWDAQLGNGELTTDEWRTQFINNQRQLKRIRENNPTAGDFKPTTQRDQDLDGYFAIWDDPAIDTDKGFNYEAADVAINAFRVRVGEKRWDDIKETLSWDKSPVVTSYLKDMQTYNEFLNTNPKYAGVEVGDTRRIDAIARKVREMQASNPGLPGKYALLDLADKGEISQEDAYLARVATAHKYSSEYEDWRSSEEGRRVTDWFRPVRNGTEVMAEVPTSSSGSKSILRSRGSSTTRRRLLSR